MSSLVIKTMKMMMMKAWMDLISIKVRHQSILADGIIHLIIDEDIQSLLTELNDTAIQALKNEDNENALECLKRGEQLLEAVTAEGKDVDRNLIIVILYNLACCY